MNNQSLEQNLKVFCDIIQKRSMENSESIKILYEKGLYGICISILRQELDSMVRVLFLLSQKQSVRAFLIMQTLNNEKWKIGAKIITDARLIENVLKLHGWARNVYVFGCSFIHLSPFHYYSVVDPFSTIPNIQCEAIKNYMMDYHKFPKHLNVTFETMQPYLLCIFEKINNNLIYYLEQLSKNQDEEFIL